MAASLPKHLRVAGIVRGRWSYNEYRYYVEALRHYDQVIYINPRQVQYRFNREQRSTDVLYHGLLLNRLAMTYVFGYMPETLLLVKTLEASGCPISDPYEAVSREGLGKLVDSIRLLRTGLGTDAHVYPSLQSALEGVRELDDAEFPLLNKPVKGNQGRGIVRLDSVAEVKELAERHFARKSDPLVLERLMDYRREYRVYLVDGRPVEGYEKLRQAGELASNLHRGGTARKLSREAQSALFSLVKEFMVAPYNQGIYGVDIAETGSGELHIIEVNRTPGFSGLNRLGLMNFPDFVHSVLSGRSNPPQSPSTADSAPRYEIALLGDTNPGDTYQERQEERGRSNILKDRGYGAAFGNFLELLGAVDYRILNLEVVVSDKRESELSGIKPYLDRTDLAQTSRLLSDLGIDMVSLANNHSMDYGAGGLSDTLATLDKAGISYTGAGMDDKAACAAAHHHFEVGSRSVHLILTGGFEFRKNHEDWAYYSGEAQAGVNAWSKIRAEEQLKALRQQYPDAFILAFPHWGSNYTNVSDRQRALAKILVDAGADLVVGHGSHTMQEVEKLDDCWVVYGLGNFVFNSPGRYAKHDVLPYGLVARLVFEESGQNLVTRLRLYPTFIDNRKSDYQSRFVSRDEFDKALRFQMPTGELAGTLQERLRVGRDQTGHYLELDVCSEA